MVLGTYVCYPRPNQTWSCDLIFGNGLLVPDNMKIPDMELHGLATGTHVRTIIENVLVDWIKESASFCDSKIALSWTCYERVKLTTFVRNRVTAIRSKINLNMYHANGKFNSTDVGTRPDKITIDSVRPGSIWLKGHPWMQRSLEEVRKEGTITYRRYKAE